MTGFELIIAGLAVGCLVVALFGAADSRGNKRW
jgi:hypothetical protein